ncbi:hypothetical protein [Desulfofustis glycolicus]|uniref:Porin n=1 Tax=Desulfofustis glycolicus DSM 9705 TaxID=1121409 RepID=A0A1M5YF16_9BACT|nr:hypothetical protein [Desulfofustis glycolicus]MCB2215206.1 hypothetical protein [Desulfobulbaceae bacterium]SHI10625.1 hypothetical protein SAMN02745124_03965 [Desulfofustis glycolicus DSM 9705]
MNSVDPAPLPLHLLSILLLGTGLALLTGPAAAADTFSFDVEEFSRKPYDFNGYAELKAEHEAIDESGALGRIDGSEPLDSTRQRATGTVQFSGTYRWSQASFNWLLTAAGQQASDGWHDTADVYEAFFDVTPATNTTATIGKTSYNWGTGYAWNPVGFINRPKDPGDPEESREGYLTMAAETIKSFDGALRNVAVTGVLLPVLSGVNEDFGAADQLDLAVKVYLLLLDTDIDLVALIGDDQTSRFGIDFSRNLTTNFEVHGEIAYRHETTKVVLSPDGSVVRRSESASSWLLGLRHLSTFELTTIIEYYHNGGGYSDEELSRFYRLVDTAPQQARSLARSGYGRPFAGRDYLYARFSVKEPFDLLYLTPALTTIVNIADGSFSLAPELMYTGFTNWELRLRVTLLAGEAGTEYGEKANDARAELRLRYYF